MSQRLDIQRHLAKGHAITPMRAFRMFGCLALSQRIGELRADGWPIESRIVKVGEKRVAEYRFKRRRRSNG